MSNVPTEQAVGVNRRRVGDTVFTVLNDIYLDLSFGSLAGINVAEAERMLVAAGPQPSESRTSAWPLSMQAEGDRSNRRDGHPGDDILRQRPVRPGVRSEAPGGG